MSLPVVSSRSDVVTPWGASPDDRVPGPRPEAENQQVRGRYPRMLKLDEDTEDRLVRWMTEEINQCYTEREPLLLDWMRWQTDYWARPERTVKNFPFAKAANIVVPLTAIAVEAVHARLMNTLFSVKPFWSIRPKTKQWIQSAKPVENWLQTEVENENSLNLYTMLDNCLLELGKLGTCCAKSGYTRELKKSVKDGVNGYEPIFVEVKNGATLEYVPIANFLIRLGEIDPQTAPWVGEEHSFSWGQLKRMALSGRMHPEAVEKVRYYWQRQYAGHSGSPSAYQERINELAHTEPIWHEPFKVKEIWCAFDVDGDHIDEEIILDFHIESGTLLSVRYNWYRDLHRPYRTCSYFPVEGRLFGIGIGKQNEQFQKEVTTIHRQRLDNATMANLFQLRVKKTSGYGPGEPMFPGKMWFVDDMNDVTPLQMSSNYASDLTNETSVVHYSEKRTGINDVLLGQPQQGTPAPATSDLARLAEGNKKFDLVLKNVRIWGGLLGQDVVANFQQFGDQQRHWLTMGEEGQWVEQLLAMPQELVMVGAIIELTVTDSITNRDVEQQKMLQLFQVITNYYDRVLQTAQLLGNPEVFGQLAQMALLASESAMRRLLETFNVVGAEELLISQQGQGNGQQAAGQQPAGLLAAAGAGNGDQAPGTGAIPGMAALLAGIGTASGGPAGFGGFGTNGAAGMGQSQAV